MKRTLMVVAWAFLAATAFPALGEWSDPFYPYRIPLHVDVPAPGEYVLELDPHLVTEWINEIDVFGFRPEHFAYDNIRLAAIDKEGHETPVDAAFQLVPGEELVQNGGFEERSEGKPAGWQVSHEAFELREHEDGSGRYLAVSGGDRNACTQQLTPQRRTWYRYGVRVRGYNSGAPHIMRTGEYWQPVDRSWYDPYVTTTAWREVSYFFYTADKSNWRYDDLQVRIERFTTEIDDVSLRECAVGLRARFEAKGSQALHLYYAPLEGVMPSPPGARAVALPPVRLPVVRTGPAERLQADIAYGIGVSNAFLDVWHAASVLKVLPDARPPAEERTAVTLGCARNEAEAFQIVLRPRRGGRIDAVSVQLAGPGGAQIPADRIEIRRAFFVPIFEPSAVDYTRASRSTFRGRLPDPLPAFSPTAFRPGDPNIPIWVDIRVPKDAPAGPYTGHVTIACSGGPIRVPVELTVWDFALPDRATCRTLLRFSRFANTGLFPFHKVESKEDKYALSRAYPAALAKYRISSGDAAGAGVWRPGGPGPASNNKAILAIYTNELPWAIDELHVNSHTLGHVSGSSVGVMTPDQTAAAAAPYGPRVASLKEHDWLQWSLLLVDEPQPKHFPGVMRFIETLRALPAGDEIRTAAFVYNAPCYEQLQEHIDIMVPINNDGGGIVSPYAMAHVLDGRETWFYYTRGAHIWIDAPAISQRFRAPKIWAFGGSGFHIWGINRWWQDMKNSPHEVFNPWLNPMTTWGNGVLAFFYPPSPLGKDLPARDMTIVPSLRLLLTRDGIEDFEYAVILESRIDEARKRGADTAGAEAALAALRRPFATPRSWAMSETYWLAARRTAAEAIEELQQSEDGE